MNERLLAIRSALLLLLSAVCLIVWLPLPTLGSGGEAYLEVHFLDVGQGDAIFIESPSGQQLLIDGGPDNQVLRELAKEMSFFDRSIDVVLATHPDSDHIGGLVDVLNRFEVPTIYLTDNENDTTTAESFTDAVGFENAVVVVARRGQMIDLGAGVVVEVLYPETSVAAYESNASSVIVMVHYGDTHFMLTGDSPKRIEEYLVLAYGEHLKSDVLKVGHHGSRTSTSELFLAEVAPQYAVISAEKESRYGHPHTEVTDVLFNAGIKTLSTAESGTLTFLSDGTAVWLQ